MVRAINLRADQMCYKWFKIQTISESLFCLSFEGPLRDKYVFRSFILIITTGPPFPRPFSSKKRRKRGCIHIFFCPRRGCLDDFAMNVRSQISFCRDQQRRFLFLSLFVFWWPVRLPLYLIHRHYRPFVFLPGTRFGPISMGPVRARRSCENDRILDPVWT